jgi:hypothetical protein
MGCSFWIGGAFQREYAKVTASEVLMLQCLEKVTGREMWIDIEATSIDNVTIDWSKEDLGI